MYSIVDGDNDLFLNEIEEIKSLISLLKYLYLDGSKYNFKQDDGKSYIRDFNSAIEQINNLVNEKINKLKTFH